MVSVSVGLVSGNTEASAQAFTTGSNAHGYSLSDVILYLSDFNDTQGTARISIYSEADSGFGGRPGSSLYVLTNPTSFTTDSTGTAHTFTAPGGATLDPDTTYFVVAEAPADGYFEIGATHTRREDTGGASGWSIGDRRYFQTNDHDWEPLSDNGYMMRIAVRGTA